MKVLVTAHVKVSKVIEVPDDVWEASQAGSDEASEQLSEAIAEAVPAFDGWDDYTIESEGYEEAGS